jgi:TonB family protein
MKPSAFLLTIFLLTFFLTPNVQSQEKNANHSFIITGKTSLPINKPTVSMMTVEYDTASTNHVYISEFRKNGSLKTKTQLLFKGQKFNLGQIDAYNRRNDLLVDGTKKEYNDAEIIINEYLFKEKKLIGQTLFYPDGKKQNFFECTANIKSGKYEFWYPTGQINLTGSYLNDQKDGEFKLFDVSGNLLRTGVYQKGKLISGDAVVENKIFDNPEKQARFRGGNVAFNDYLMSKTAQLQCIKQIPTSESYVIGMDLTIAETGKLIGINVTSSPNAFDNEVLSAAFGKFPGYIPASVENMPVKSILSMNLLVTNKGLRDVWEAGDSTDMDIYNVVEQMPEYPGGELALQKLLLANLRYPPEAAEKGIQGSVMISIVIEKDGSISNIHVVRGVDPLVDAESVRVILLSSKWIPGRQNGELVRVKFTVPINFVLQEVKY